MKEIKVGQEYKLKNTNRKYMVVSKSKKGVIIHSEADNVYYYEVNQFNKYFVLI